MKNKMSYNDFIAFTSMNSAIEAGYSLSHRFSQANASVYFYAIALLNNDGYCIVDCANEANYGFRYALVVKQGISKEDFDAFWNYYRLATKCFMVEIGHQGRENLLAYKRKERVSHFGLQCRTTLDTCRLLQRFREGEYKAFSKALFLSGNGKFQIIDCLRMENFGYRFALVCEENTTEEHITEFYRIVRLYRKF
jgi:hypothetical protein